MAPLITGSMLLIVGLNIGLSQSGGFYSNMISLMTQRGSDAAGEALLVVQATFSYDP